MADARGPAGLLRRKLAPYAHARWSAATWQLVDTLVPFVACWAAAYRWLDTRPLAAAASCLLATGFLVRIYIVQHDCGHGSFLPSARANDALGCVLSVLTLLPYFRWRHDHARHHATSGHLARRGTGDVWTMTVREYREARPAERLRYRVYRHPLVLFGLGPLVLFCVLQRLSYWTRTPREKRSVWATNAALVLVLSVGAHVLDPRRMLLVQGAITWLGATVAVWLFYVQHQFASTTWEAPPAWSFEAAALHGSSYYRLPRLLQFFTGSIGLHHVHHVCPRIPNYTLQRCLDEVEELRAVPALTLWASLRCASLRVWDEDAKRLVSWRELELEEWRERAAPRTETEAG